MTSQLGAIQLRQPVRNLGDTDPRLEGIYTPGYSDAEINQHVHDTFLKHADAYLRFCPVDRPSIDHWKLLIRIALDDFVPQTVTDIGSGGGITVFPTLELFPHAQVIATDLALPLLSELRNLARRDHLESLTVLQMNAEQMVIADEQVDLVMGGNVLHHALSLETMFAEIRRILRPGGRAVFWEAFEHGPQLLAGIFDTWLEMSPHQLEPLSDSLIASLKWFIRDLQSRAGRNKSPEMLAVMDDKWIFTHGHVRDLAAATGFTRCEMRNIYGPQNVVQVLGDHELRRKGHSWDALPEWAQQKLLQTQARFSDDYLNENPFCCGILLNR